MKKIVRLTESDLTRIVRRVIKENENEQIEADKFLSNINVNQYCSEKGVPKMVTNILNKLPEGMRVKAKEFIKSFGNAISNKSFKELLNIRKEVKSQIQNAESKNLKEQLAPIMIAGTVIAPSLLIAIGAIILFIIVIVIINNSGKGGGSCNPGWWDNL